MDFGGTRDCISCYIRACLSSLTPGNLPDGAKGGAAPHRYEMWLLQRVAGCTSGACRGVSACLSCHGHAANTGIVGGPRGDLARPSRLHTAGFLHRVRCAPSRWSSASLPCFLLFHVPCNSRPSWRRNRCRLLIFPPPSARPFLPLATSPSARAAPRFEKSCAGPCSGGRAVLILPLLLQIWGGWE